MKTITLGAACLGLLALAGCQTAGTQLAPSPTAETAGPISPPAIIPPTDPDIIGELRAGSGYLAGYLDPANLPDSAALLPPPPEDGSARAMADLEVYQKTRELKDTARWQLAYADNELHFPEAAQAFSCTLGVEISYDTSPHLMTLLRRTLVDAGRSTYRAKELYQRTRPFALMGDASCVPEAEEMLASDGSYPSGHAALGWTWGLVLAGIAPERSDDLLQRGYDFGESRLICGVHWQSDVEAGRVMGAASFARLQADPVFRAQAELARQETEAAWSSGNLPAGCDYADDN